VGGGVAQRGSIHIVIAYDKGWLVRRGLDFGKGGGEMEVLDNYP
jgi:hypothetical protein